jgi:hypothetical protein
MAHFYALNKQFRNFMNMKSQTYVEAKKKNDTKYYSHTTLSGTPGGGSERFLGGGD